MTIEKFIEKFENYSGVSINTETIVRNLDEWDSLTVQLMIQDEFNSSIPGEEFLYAKAIYII